MKKDHIDTLLPVLGMIVVCIVLLRFLEVHSELVETSKELNSCLFYQEYAITSVLNQ